MNIRIRPVADNPLGHVVLVSRDGASFGISIPIGSRNTAMEILYTVAAFLAQGEDSILPRSCPDCGAGIVIGTKFAVCEANKYSSWSGAGDCRWELVLTPKLRREADEALAAQEARA